LAILETEILVNIGTGKVSHYEKLGYEIPKITKYNRTNVKKDTKLLVKVTDLPPNSNLKVTKVCDLCGNKTYTSYFAILKQRQNNNETDLCRNCSSRRSRMEKAKENLLSINRPLLINEWVMGVGKGMESLTPFTVSTFSNYTVLWRCSREDCNYEWEAKISDRSNGSGCPACWGRVVSDRNRLSLRFPELIKEWNQLKNEDLLPSDLSYASHIEVWWMCLECNWEWRTPVHSRTIMKSNCPACSESKGEKRIRKWLHENVTGFEPQKEFIGLVGTGGGLLSYDFYLPKQNLLIEYQGEFHDGNGNYYIKENLEVQQEHDRRKREYAELNNIKLLEIWYWDYDNVEEILQRELIFNKEELNV
jgi:hypothetical protein